MIDIVKRLQTEARVRCEVESKLSGPRKPKDLIEWEAANEIERLRKEVDQLRDQKRVLASKNGWTLALRMANRIEEVQTLADLLVRRLGGNNLGMGANWARIGAHEGTFEKLIQKIRRLK